MLRKVLSSSLVISACLFPALSATAFADKAKDPGQTASSSEQLSRVLAAQPGSIKERYGARHPLETLNFFEIREGDVVIETLPGRGWYSGILYSYLGKKGKLIGAHYPREIFVKFGWDEARIKTFVDRGKNWPKSVSEANSGKGGELDSFTMAKMPDRFSGVADKVLFIRSLHNLNRFNKDGGFFDKAIEEAFRSLKSGGIVGVVQHRAPETATDEWADGSRGYLKQSKIIAAFENAGFKFVEAREINANPKDKPSGSDVVWRLPPILRGSKKGSDKWTQYKNIGESDRMTLKFVKP